MMTLHLSQDEIATMDATNFFLWIDIGRSLASGDLGLLPTPKDEESN